MDVDMTTAPPASPAVGLPSPPPHTDVPGLPTPSPASARPPLETAPEKHFTRLRNPLISHKVGMRDVWDPTKLEKEKNKEKRTQSHSHSAKMKPIPQTQNETVKMEVDDEEEDGIADSYPSPPASLPLPSFITSTSFSSSDSSNSSSDSDSLGQPKPPKAPRRKNKPRPSYYYDEHYDPANPDGKKKRGRRGGFKGVPVFEPSLEEFEKEGGFYEYVKKIEKYGMRSGIVKVVPPAEWTSTLPSTISPLSQIRLREPIEQHILGSQGLYRVTNVAKTRIWNPAQWKKMSLEKRWESPDFKAEKEGREKRSETKVATPTPRGKGKGKEKEEQEQEESGPTPRLTRAAALAKESASGSKKKKNGVPESPTSPSHKRRKSTTASPSSSKKAKADEEVDPGAEADLDEEDAVSVQAKLSRLETKGELSQAGSTTTPTPKKKRPTVLQRAEPTEAEWQEFMGTFEELPHGLKKEDYTIEMMREVERRYWRTLTFGESPMYGADMAGSLFNDSTKSWNVAHLGDLLPKLAPSSCKIPGVVSPYLYFGMWRATFAWHVEDADLYSINYIHFGAPKFWYSVPQESSERFERVMEGFFPTDRSKCPEFLRHKAFLASPRVLANSGIVLNRAVQLPGEFILTYPKGYHSGFNLGFNCAESINFATERWLPLGKVAKACTCIGDSVSIDVDAWLNDASRAEALARGDILEDGTSTRKRPAPTPTPTPAPLEPAQKKKKVEPLPVAPALPPPPPEGFLSKKVKVELEKSIKADSWVCALCPDMNEEGLVRIGEPGVKSRKQLAAHRVCVMFTPATWIDTEPGTEEEIVRGYAGIEKARWKLKCQLCPEKHGTKVQCTKGKCPKAYHVTCALNEGSGVFLDATIGEDGPSLLKEARAELDAAREAAKLGSPKVPSRIAIPHRSLTIPETPNPASVIPSVLAPVPATSDTPVLPDGQVPTVLLPSVTIEPAPIVDDGGIKLSILCRVHNPEWQKLENARKATELLARVNELALQSRVRVKTSGGVFEVTYVGNIPGREAIAVVFDDGKRSDAKWRNIVWPDSLEVARRKEQAAEKARAENVYVWENRPIAPTKRSSYGTPSTAPSTSASASASSGTASAPTAARGQPAPYPPFAHYGPPQPYPYGYAPPSSGAPGYPPPPPQQRQGNSYAMPLAPPPPHYSYGPPPQQGYYQQAPWTSYPPGPPPHSQYRQPQYPQYAAPYQQPHSQHPANQQQAPRHQVHPVPDSNYRSQAPPSQPQAHSSRSPFPAHSSTTTSSSGGYPTHFSSGGGSGGTTPTMFRSSSTGPGEGRVPSPALSVASNHSHKSAAIANLLN